MWQEYGEKTRNSSQGSSFGVVSGEEALTGTAGTTSSRGSREILRQSKSVDSFRQDWDTTKQNIGSRSHGGNPASNAYKSNEGSGPGSPGAILASDMDKKRLVKQFYKVSANESMSKPVSFMDLDPLHKMNKNVTPGGPTGAAASNMPGTFMVPNDLQTEDILKQIAANGIQHGPIDDCGNDDKLTSHKATVEEMRDKGPFDKRLPQVSPREKGSTELLDVTQLEPLASLSRKLASAASDFTSTQLKEVDEGASKTTSTTSASLSQLTTLQRVLQDTHGAIIAMLKDLHVSREPMQDIYKSSIATNIQRLTELCQHLSSLEDRLTSTKAVVSRGKESLSRDLLDRITLLEEIDVKIRHHSKKSREKRLKYLCIAAAVLAAGFSVYLAYTH
ncbi:Piso0_000198 [Millerozyma farinosa CBS 7064]|uniref:Piso0_000198 protein n=1 Tax=Pichia sorbitophila (strain ATCC MYA-4447 / BCRC 22081 / CBS 7064 / NBRC 10061 / NRRL Y-12695) TaxID=559304 RepID=G8YTC4_PICSO|nr:Piso0_000198 [Millerozyma farinosa CBS 7064]